MARGISLHIGVDVLDANHYLGFSDLKFCGRDATAMEELAGSMGFETTLLVDQDATREAVETHINRAASELAAGDMFLLTFAGHGAQVPDLNRDERRARGGTRGDKYDETWCLYDKQQLDDERVHLWGKFADDVRVLIVSDSCHSGTAHRGGGDVPKKIGSRRATRSASADTYKADKEFYDQLQRDPPERIGAKVVLISACQDHQEAGEDAFNEHGTFTHSLLNVWSGGEFNGDYAEFRRLITLDIDDDTQQPNLVPESGAFVGETPFSLGGEPAPQAAAAVSEGGIDIGIAAAQRQDIAAALSRLLADSYTLYLKTHNYHWNVTGPRFRDLHLLFEEHYTELAMAVDAIAERIRTLGLPAPGTYREFAELTSIEESTGVPSAEDMLADLIVAQEAVVRTARRALPLAQDAADESSASLIADRMAVHEKAAWMLRSMRR